MTDADDAMRAAGASAVVVDASAPVPPLPSDDLATRRAALRDLAAMIGAEVFY